MPNQGLCGLTLMFEIFKKKFENLRNVEGGTYLSQVKWQQNQKSLRKIEIFEKLKIKILSWLKHH